jgi:adenosylcobinamide kinase/adenosylcobinamide-phosphate guanylyltransferase
MSIHFIGGGARSGKSSHALRVAAGAGPRKAFVATARPLDEEMRERIEWHRRDRDPSFATFEEPLEVAGFIRREQRNFDVIVVDCLTLWLSNLLAEPDAEIERRCRELIEVAAAASAKVLLVGNEVGCGIVPENPLVRRFRDLAGMLNRLAAENAKEVDWMVFGVPVRIKGANARPCAGS